MTNIVKYLATGVSSLLGSRSNTKFHEKKRPLNKGIT